MELPILLLIGTTISVCVWIRARLRQMDERVTAQGLRIDFLETRLWRSEAPPAAVQPPPRPSEAPASSRAPVSAAPGGSVIEVPHREAEAAVQQRAPEPPAAPPASAPPAAEPSPVWQAEAPAPSRHVSRDWEATLGGNWLNKAGVLLLVIGLALALGYSFAHIGPTGRVLVSLAVSFAMLAAGAVFEPRPRYRIFARGLLGGGWAALYTTVYAMHAIREARVVESPVAGALLLIAVAAGMILHSLRYRSETVTGLAYFIAFATLSITQANALAMAALVPLAASLLYLAHRFAWRRMALAGLIATYGTCILRGDTGAPLWQAQSIFALFWLLFEIFDVLHPETWLVPLNAAGFLGLSLLKWHAAAPQDVWMLLSASAGAYLASALARARSSKWRGAATLAAALAAAAVFQKLDRQWIASALVVEAELVYLAGLRLGQRYLRWLGTSLFALELGRLLFFDVNFLLPAEWVPVASLDVAVFYANRALCAADLYFGYAAAFVAAVIAGREANDQARGLAWFLTGASLFLLGWWRRQFDFRIQAYALALLGVVAIAFTFPQPLLALGVVAALSYAARFAAARLPEDERGILRHAAAVATVAAVGTLIWRVVPGDYLGIAWMAAALILAELGLPHAVALAAIGALRVFYFNALPAHNYGPWIPRAIPAAAAAMSYLAAWRARRILSAASAAGTVFLLVSLWTLLPVVLVGPAWALAAVALMEFDVPALRIQAHVVSAAAFARVFAVNLTEPYRLPSVMPVLLSHYYLWWRARRREYLYAAAALAMVLMYYEIGRTLVVVGWAPFAAALLYAGLRWSLPDLRRQSYIVAAIVFLQCLYVNVIGDERAVAAASIAIACLFAGQLLSPRTGRARLYSSLLATALATALLFAQSSGSMLTVAWGVEGMALLAAGFALRDRLLRLPGLALLVGCILKLFVWDLRHLDTLPRIFSFIVLGLILVGVSWVYSRFKEHVSRLL